MARQRASRAASPPATPHPAVLTGSRKKAFGSSKAEKWVITSAIISLVVYAFRRLIEGETSPAPSTSAARSFLGSGSPPNLAQWAIAYVVAYGGLSLLAVATPELAAALAAFVVIATILDSGGQLATDLTNLEHNAGSGSTESLSTLNAANAAQAEANLQALGKQVVAGTAPTNATVYVIGPNGQKTPVSSAFTNVDPKLSGSGTLNLGKSQF